MKPTILLMGTVHLSNVDNGDALQMNVEGLHSEKRKKELEEVINCLVEFQPTKIAVEIGKDLQSELNSEYEQYLNGSFELTTHEHHQVGFRLAERMKLTQLHAVDWNERRGNGENPWEWAKEHQSNLLEEIQVLGNGLMRDFNEKYESSSIRDVLLWLNTPAYAKRNQVMYSKIALIGNEQNPVGIQWLSDYWDYRNLMIYRNIVELVNSSENRILIIYGAAHITLLSQYLKDSELFQVEQIDKYLGTVRGT